MDAAARRSREPTASATPTTSCRLMVKVARMYHERGMRQTEIAAELHISQPRVSRLLKRPRRSGSCGQPYRCHGGARRSRGGARGAYGLDEAVVVDVGGSDVDVSRRSVRRPRSTWRPP